MTHRQWIGDKEPTEPQPEGEPEAVDRFTLHDLDEIEADLAALMVTMTRFTLRVNLHEHRHDEWARDFRTVGANLSCELGRLGKVIQMAEEQGR